MVFTSHSHMERAGADWFRNPGQQDAKIFCEWSDLLHRDRKSSNFHRFHRNQTEVREVTQKSPLSSATTPVYSPSPPRNQQKMSPKAKKTSSLKTTDILSKAPNQVQDTTEEGQISDEPNNICRHYRRGQCSYGSTCRYPHV